MTFDITQIVVALIGLLSAVITGFLIPWIKSKININNDKISDNQRAILKQIIVTAVTAAEQLYNSDQGKEKKAYVVDLLEKQGYHVDNEALDSAIEAAVYELHHAIIPENPQ